MNIPPKDDPIVQKLSSIYWKKYPIDIDENGCYDEGPKPVEFKTKLCIEALKEEGITEYESMLGYLMQASKGNCCPAFIKEIIETK